MKELTHAYVCIMAGGSGERFWPMSRQRTPKHLLKLFSHRTLVEETVRRLEGVVPRAHIFILTNEAQLEGTRAALAEHGVWMGLKGKHPADEIAALPADVAVFHVEQLVVPGLDAERCMVWMRRVGS